MPSKRSLTWLLVFVLLGLTCLPAAGAATEPAAPRGPAPDWTAPHVAGQLLVKLADSAAVSDAAALEARLAAYGVRALGTIPQLGLALVQPPAGATLNQAAAELTGQAGIEWAEPNYIFRLDLVPDDPLYLTNQSAALSRIQMPAAWDLTLGRPEVVIAVLDTGVDITHPDLVEAIWTNPGETPDNGVDDDANGFVDDVHGWDFAAGDNDVADDHGHGTHVAGIAAARTNNGIGVAGVAGRATLMPVDVFGGGIGTYEDLIRAIVYATDNGAHVINMSLGASSYSRGEEMAVNYAWERGVVVVAAAGNTCQYESPPNNSKPPCLSDHYPAAHRNVIAVAATTAGDVLASFSTRGTFVDVAAPGVGIYSTFPGGGYGSLSGTSMATPHVSGLAALVLSRNPYLSPDQVRLLIELGTEDLGPKGPDIYFGYGRIDARRTLEMTEPDTRPFPVRPVAPPLDFTLAGCTELIPDGDFAMGLGAWQAEGSFAVDAYSGNPAAHFSGGPNATGTLTRTVTLPPNSTEGVLWFRYRIENADGGWGTDPAAPYDDTLTLAFRSAEGAPLATLLRTGNSADTVSDGLPWDRYLYRMEAGDLTGLTAADPLHLVFTAANDEDSAKTDFWIDDVRFCVREETAEPPQRLFLPMVIGGM
jgi:subtilisin family serine protease